MGLFQIFVVMSSLFMLISFFTGALIYLLDLFCNSTNPQVRIRTAELFSKMMSDKLIGPKVRIVLSKFLPTIFMDAMRDSPDASVHMFEGILFIYYFYNMTYLDYLISATSVVEFWNADVHTHAWMRTHPCTHTPMHAHTHAHAHTCAHPQTCAHPHTCKHMQTHANTHTRMQTHIRACTHAHVCMHRHARVDT